MQFRCTLDHHVRLRVRRREREVREAKLGRLAVLRLARADRRELVVRGRRALHENRMLGGGLTSSPTLEMLRPPDEVKDRN